MRKWGVCHYFNYFCKRMLMVGRRTQSGRTADGIQSGGGRNPIGRRSESDRTADEIRSGGERNLIGRRTESDRAADANDHSM